MAIEARGRVLPAKCRVSIASLAAFRVLFGLLLAAAMVRFVAGGWVHELYVAPRFHFAWEGLEWIRPWPGPWMYVHFWVLALLGLCIAAGAFYRVATALFFLGFTWVECLDKANYLNHYYLVSLLCGLMVVVPAHRALSVDCWRDPGLRIDAIEPWPLWLLRFQIAVVYVYAGIAKLDADWLFRAQPLRIWLSARADLPWIGPWLDEAWVAYLASWTGAVYDLAVVPLLCWRLSRPWALLAVVVFHSATAVLFNIGMFPWIMIAASTLFLPADWPLRWTRHRLPAAGTTPIEGVATAARVRVRTALIAAYAGIQVALPLRAYAGADNCAWSFRGFNFSWHVMIAEKHGAVDFLVRDPVTGSETEVAPRRYLTRRQELMMAQDPWMIRALARHIAAEARATFARPAQVRVRTLVTLNGRPARPLIRPDIDLAASLPSDWILPLGE